MRRAIFLPLVLALVASACTTQTRAEWRIGPAPTCDTTSRGRLLLIAQSVPDATLIPCIGDLPRGWEISTIHSRMPGSVLVFTNNTFDLDADVVLSPSCDVSSARPADSPRVGTQLFVGSDGKTYVFTFAGGCITFVYETRLLAESEEGRALIEAVPFMTRDTLRELSGWTL